MIVIPEKVAFIKVPKAASTTIARMFWDTYDVKQLGTLNPEVASNVRHFVPLEQVAEQIPVLNGNWFFNRSIAFGWHSSFKDLFSLFGNQLSDYHWLASVRHPVARLFSVFSFQIKQGRLAASVCAGDFEKFCAMVFARSPRLSQQQLIHTWPQWAWLPPEMGVRRITILRQETLIDDMRRLEGCIPSLSVSKLGHEGRSFNGQWQDYVSSDLRARIEQFYAEDMRRFGYATQSVAQECGVAK